jgi:hypothetical protein
VALFSFGAVLSINKTNTPMSTSLTPFEHQEVVQAARSCAWAYDHLIEDADGISAIKQDVHRILLRSGMRANLRDLDECLERIQAMKASPEHDQAVVKRCEIMLEAVRHAYARMADRFKQVSDELVGEANAVFIHTVTPLL